MKISDETLMAYADGELNGADAASVAAAVSADEGLARRLDQIHALNRAVKSAFEPTLAEPVPERLIDAVGRAGRSAPPTWLAIAATLVIGVLAGAGVTQLSRTNLTGGSSGLDARGALAAELERGRASASTGEGVVTVGLSYRTADAYCRTFDVSGPRSWAGVACRRNGAWAIEAAVRTAPALQTVYRQADSPVPEAIAGVIDQKMVGRPLDAAQEGAAITRGWTLPDHRGP